MDSLDKIKLQQQLTNMKDNISEVDVVVDHLVTMGTFSLEQRSQIILTHSTTRENIQRMIDLLIKSGPTAFNNFLTALTKTGEGNRHVADVLKTTEVASPSRTGTFVIEKGSKEEVSEMEGGLLSLKELNKAFESLKSKVEEHEEFKQRYLVTKAELKRKKEECRQLKEQLDTSDKEHKQKISKLEETIEKLESELISKKRRVKQLEDTINRNKEEDKKENKDNGVKGDDIKPKTTKNANRSNGTKTKDNRPPFNSTSNSSNVSQNAFYGVPRKKRHRLPPLNE